MGRPLRVIKDGVPYHVTQRGNHQQAVFDTDRHRFEFLGYLGKQLIRHRIRLLSYCLMTNHVHLIVVPEVAGSSLSVAMKQLFHRHALRLNCDRGRSGHLWTGRFRACEMDQSHLYHAMRYVELNPVRANLVNSPEQWAWSSARYHLGLSRPACLIEDREWQERFTHSTWGEWMDSPHDAIVIDRIREATRLGIPLWHMPYARDAMSADNP